METETGVCSHVHRQSLGSHQSQRGAGSSLGTEGVDGEHETPQRAWGPEQRREGGGLLGVCGSRRRGGIADEGRCVFEEIPGE